MFPFEFLIVSIVTIHSHGMTDAPRESKSNNKQITRRYLLSP